MIAFFNRIRFRCNDHRRADDIGALQSVLCSDPADMYQYKPIQSLGPAKDKTRTQNYHRISD
jgi:hypothetical protein